MDRRIINFAAACFIITIVIPGTIELTIDLASRGVNGVKNLAHKAKIKKGLKDGSIVEIDGKYYEVSVENTSRGEVVDVEEA